MEGVGQRFFFDSHGSGWRLGFLFHAISPPSRFFPFKTFCMAERSLVNLAMHRSLRFLLFYHSSVRAFTTTKCWNVATKPFETNGITNEA
jgi:hypothetical protein